MALSSNILERLSTRAKQSLVTAQRLAQDLGHREITASHVFYGVLAESRGFIAEILSRKELLPEQVRSVIEDISPVIITGQNDTKMSEELVHCLESAAVSAQQYRYQFIGTEHLLFALTAPTASSKAVFERLGIDPEQTRKNLQNIFEHYSKLPDFLQAEEEATDEKEEARGKTPGLDYFATDLTAAAAEGKLDPLIGRDREVQRVIAILNRRIKNNPVLIGEPGVGKTAVVEGLAFAIVRGAVPEFLLDKRILSLDLASIVAGSMFRGEFENRLKQIIDEVRSSPNTIVFIDELHTLVGAGATTGSLDAANILKPSLARGEISVIGATTLADYKKYVETDAALERRFQPVLIEEPSVEETKRILHGLKSRYEAHHKIKIHADAIDAAVELSARYIPDRYLPDKALDILDESASSLMSARLPSRELLKLRALEADIERLTQEKTQAVLKQDFTAAAELKLRLEEKNTARQKLIETRKNKQAQYALELAPEHIQRTISSITKIPLERISASEHTRLQALERRLGKRIVGQDEVLSAVAGAIRRSRTGISSPQRPIGSFLFLGPTGVGKTELAKALAEELFGSERDLIRVDMSEFMERHTVARLVGAPAGYVGYEEGGRLTETVRRKPYSVILFDEIEKAHPDVFNLLLQILEEGELTDAAGKKINFKNTIIILTSNIGSSQLNDYAMGFAERMRGSSEQQPSLPDYQTLRDTVLKDLREHLSVELLNRIDHTLVFRPLDEAALKKIVALELDKLSARMLAHKQLRLVARPAVIEFLHRQSSDPKAGARKIRRHIQEYVESALSDLLLRTSPKPKTRLTLKLNKKGDKKAIDLVVA